MSRVAASPAMRRVGRFELRRELGRGAQASVWLGFDSRLEREVAVKLLIAGADSVAVSQWLHEARAVSRLTHPHIVPVFEADEDRGQSYLVFEFVDGPTLSQRLRQRGPLPGREAAAMMLGVLDALRVAHEAGVIHRDLKPSNILVDTAGRARVMDFGIAARVGDGHDRSIVGTPGYMSPEAARGDPPSPQMDVFAAGAMLGELLAGTPLLRERDPYRAIHRVQHEDLALPTQGPRIDDGLRAIVLRAVARDKDQRYATAAQMHQALAQWLQPGEAGEPGAAQGKSGAKGGNGTLEFLLRRMRHKSDFPALSQSVVRIQRVANSDKESLHSLTGEILKDVALTNKLLRMVNSAQFSHAGGGTISTVSRAVALVGFAGIRNMALSLVLLDHMQDKTHAAQLKDEFLRCMMAGQLASGLTTRARDVEEAFLGAMFRNLGRLLAEFYFPEEAARIRQLLAPGPGTASPSAESAAKQVLGLSLEELGLGVARSWGIPDNLQRCMLAPEAEVPARAVDLNQRLPWLARVANEVADVMLQHDGEEGGRRVREIAEKYTRVLDVGVRDIEGAVGEARNRLGQMVQAMGIDVAPGSAARRLVAQPAAAPDSLSRHELRATVATAAMAPTVRVAAAPAAAPAAAAADKTLVLAPPQATAPATAADPPATVVPDRAQAVEMLAAGIQDITNTMVSDNFRLNEVLRMILETMFRALGFQRVVFCLRDPKTDMLTGRFGLGEGAREVAAAFQVPMKAGPTDLLAAVCAKGLDTQIADARAANLAARLPNWYRDKVNAPAFVLLPLAMKGATFALIYADHAQARAIELGEHELSLLRTLRNQAVMAFKQVGS